MYHELLLGNECVHSVNYNARLSRCYCARELIRRAIILIPCSGARAILSGPADTISEVKSAVLRTGLSVSVESPTGLIGRKMLSKLVPKAVSRLACVGNDLLSSHNPRVSR